MTIALYARVSTKDKGQDTENQLRELRQFAEASGYHIYKEYIDHESAKSGDRAQFKAMFADSAKRKFKGVLVWALDRFTREGIEETFNYVSKLKTDGIDFISFTEPHFRTTGPAGELMLAIAAWIAKQERARISERTRAGMETARRRGQILGAPRKPVDADRIRSLHAAGNGAIKIAAQLGGISRETVRRVIAGTRP